MVQKKFWLLGLTLLTPSLVYTFKYLKWCSFGALVSHLINLKHAMHLNWVVSCIKWIFIGRYIKFMFFWSIFSSCLKSYGWVWQEAFDPNPDILDLCPDSGHDLWHDHGHQVVHGARARYGPQWRWVESQWVASMVLVSQSPLNFELGLTGMGFGLGFGGLGTGLNHKLYLVIPFPDNEMHNGTFKTLGPRIQRGYRMVDSNITIKSFY